MSGEGNDGHLYRQSVREGALCLIGSAAVFSAVGAIVKHLTRDLPLEMVVFFRSAGGLLFLLPWLAVQRGVSLRTRRFGGHAARALSGVAAMYCFFYTISQLHLAEAIVLNFTAPLIIPIVAWIMLGERIPRSMAGLLVVGFAGVMLVVKPGSTVFQSAAVVGIASALFASFALVSIRNLTRTEPAVRVVFYFALIASVVTLVPMLRVWRDPQGIQWLLLVAMGGLATVGQWLLTRGYAAAPAGQVGYYQYSAVIFAGGIDRILWGSRLDGISLAGIGLICVAGIIASRTARTPPPARAV